MEVIIRRTKKVFKTIGWAILVVVLLLVGFHIWFVNHSEKTIERLIAWQSNGKLRAKIKKFSIDYFNNNAEIRELTIFNADTVIRGTAYQFKTKELRFNIRSKWDLVFHKKLLIDSLVFTSPDIIITRKAHRDSAFKKLPLAEELGNVYSAINNSLVVLNLERFEINEGKVLVKDAGMNGKNRFELNHIFLSIDHLKIDSTNIKSKHSFAFSDRVLLRILKQRVKLPDDTSSISFNQLLIDSKLGIIEIANPSIKIYPPIGLKNSFKASATQLNITGLDFNTLYSQPLIKIDSVFMQNPQGDLQFYRKDKKVNKKPLDDALRNLPVAVNINHVVMQNGTVIVGLHQGNKTTTFDTKNDNLSIVGISLNDTASKVLNIKGFNYTIRNYVGYTADSIYRYKFDSLHFIDNRIILYNFNITTIKKVQSILIRNYTVPKFEITAMDWPSFLFYNHFKAHKAVLYDAVFNIEKNNSLNIKASLQNKKSIYQTLSVMDDLFDLNELKVINGEFNAKQGEDLSLHIGHLNWDINANELTGAKTFKQLINSIKELSFDTATATNAALTLHISKSKFINQDKKLLFDHVMLKTNNKSVEANLNTVAVSDFSFDNKELDVKEIHWNDGNIHIDGRNIDDGKIKPINRKSYAFSLNKISGNNSTLSFENDNIKATINIKEIKAISLSKSADASLQLNGLFVDGKNAVADLHDAQLTCETLEFTDGNKSFLNNVLFVSKTKADTAVIQLPFVSFIPFVNKTIASKAISIDAVYFKKPQIFLATMAQVDKAESTTTNTLQIPAVQINGMTMDDAIVHLSFGSEISKTVVDSKRVSLNIKHVFSQADKLVSVNNIALNSNEISFIKNEDAIFTSTGNISLRANSFLYNPFKKYWQLNLDKFSIDSFKYLNKEDESNKSIFSINNIKINHVIANNNDLEEGLPWLVNKSTAFISFDNLHWQNTNNNFQLHDFLFDAIKKQIVIDSMSIEPVQSKEEFVDKLVYRKAYTNANSGKILMDRPSYYDGLIHIPHVLSNNISLNIFSDNLKKAKAQTIKPMPIDAIKEIGLPLLIDTLQLNNMLVNYTEINALTKKTGNVNFSTINGNVFNINTKPTLTTDSLRLDVMAHFLDKIPLHLAMQSSYIDTAKGFALQLNVGKGDANILNPVLEPFILLRAKSGFIDSMQMLATANDYKAHGTMRLYYHGLKAELLDSGIVTHPRFRTKFYSFLANSFAIRNNNTKRITTFDFARVRTKSAINYLLKMIVEGAAGNVMPQASKILIKKQLKKEAKKQAVNTNAK